MLDELDGAFQDLLAHEPRVALTVRRDEFELDGTSVFSEEHVEESLPFAFHRDGIRRLAFSQGLTRQELTGLLMATSQRLHYAGLGEDIVSLLWRLDLEHIDYVVVDTTIVTAAADEPTAETDPSAASASVGTDMPTDMPIDKRLAGVLHALFGPGTEGSPVSIHLDAFDAPAKAVADALDRPEALSPNLRPTTGLRFEARYARDVLDEVIEEGDDAIAMRGLEGALRAFREPLTESELTELGEGLLRMVDTAVLESQFGIAARIVYGMRHVPQPRERIAQWMDQVVAEARIRHVGARYTNRVSDDERSQIVEFFRACGAWAVQPLLQLIPSISHAASRREVADLVLEFGIFDLRLLRPLLASDQAFVVQEAVYMLSRLSHEGSLEILRELRHHPLPQVRASLAESAESLPKDAASDLVANLMDDEDPRVRSTAARALAKHPSKTTELLLESAGQKPRLDGAPLEVKRATLEAYAQVAQERAVQPIARYIRDGEGIFAGRDQEELAVAATWALARIRTVTAVEILKRTCASRNRRLKHVAREALVWMKENV